MLLIHTDSDQDDKAATANLSAQSASGNPGYQGGPKLGFSGAAGFGSLSNSAAYGGAFNNSILPPDRVGSSNPSDLSVILKIS
jgi:hypothetical protein